MSASRQHLAVSAVLVTSLTVAAVAACGSNSGPVANAIGTLSPQSAGANPGLSASPSGGAGASGNPPASAAAFPVGTMLESNGTSTVTVGGRKVAFPTTVTGAAWSRDGSRIAFIDADGNVDSSRPDGTGRLVLTKHQSGVTRSDPTWAGGSILFTQRRAGHSIVTSVNGNGWADPDVPAGQSVVGGSNGDAAMQDNSAPSAGPKHEFADTRLAIGFVHQGSKGSEVWIQDEYQRDVTSVKAGLGTDPAVSPDGNEIAYLGTDGQIRTVSTVLGQSGKVKPSTAITAGLSGAGHLAWTADGDRVVFSTASGVEAVSAAPAGAAGSNKPVAVDGTAGASTVVTFLGAVTDRAERLGSGDPVADAITASKARWEGMKTFYVSQSSLHASSAALANPGDPDAAALVSNDEPLLYTAAGSLDPRTKAELVRLFGAPDTADGVTPTITIVGDDTMISAATQKAVQKLGYQTQRVSGADRYAVDAASLATAPVWSGMKVIVVSGDDPALAAAEACGGAQIVLTKGATLPAAAATFLSKLDTGMPVYVVGSEARQAINAWNHMPSGVRVTPLVGSDAAQTSALIARQLFGDTTGVVLLDPRRQTDRAAAIPAAQQLHYPVLLVDPAKGIDPATTAFLQDSSAAIDTTVVAGPIGRISDPLVTRLGDAVSGPLGFTFAAML